MNFLKLLETGNSIKKSLMLHGSLDLVVIVL